MPRRVLVVDANILINAVLGRRVRYLIETYEGVTLYMPESAFVEAERNLLVISPKLGAEPGVHGQILEFLTGDMERIEVSDPRTVSRAKARMKRHLVDWPIVAAALDLDCPNWTDDADFFGCGIATWTTATVEIYLAGKD